MKKIYLLCNAHLDPVWQWTWDEGLAEALSTFRIAADFCEEFDGFVFNHNEALLYEWVEEYDPDLFARIKRLVECGKWHIMGGWYLQPDCNMPSGESMLRQILTGRRYFQQKFGKAPTTAINFDPFGHSRGMVQLLAKCGFDSYIVTRPSREVCPVPAEDFIWVGYEGSEVAVHIANEGYNTLLGQATEKIRAIVSAHENSDSALVLWGVGNHGGGPSRSDLRKIAELKEEWESQGIELIHSTPEAFFAAMDKSSLPHFAEGLNPSMVGCYTSQVRIKQKHRLLENMLFQTEKMMAAAELKTDFRGDWKKIEEAEKLLLFSEFHDILPGSSIEKVEEESLRMLDHGIDLLQTQRVKAFTAFASMQSRQEEGDIPVIVYNPHPYPVSTVVECEFNLADQNWSDSRTVFTVTCDGTTVPSQVEKEGSNIPLDWRKKVTFFAELKPFSTAVYACTPRLVPAESLKRNSESVFELVGRHSSLNIDPQTGFISSYQVEGVEQLQGGSGKLLVIKDNCDPWGMTVTSFRDVCGEFHLATREEAGHAAGLSDGLSPITLVEDGDVRSVVEVLMVYESSVAVVRYTLNKMTSDVGVSVRIRFMEPDRAVKLSFLPAFSATKVIGQTIFGREELKTDGSENVSQKWLAATDGEQTFSVLNTGSYGSDFRDGELHLTLLRSAAYTAHPIGDRQILTKDRFLPRIDIGEREFHFVIKGGTTEERMMAVDREAAILNEPPYAVNFFPSGSGDEHESALSIDNAALVLSSFRRNENGYILRIFNPTETVQDVEIQIPPFAICAKERFSPYEVRTFLAKDGELEELTMDEKTRCE